MRPTPDGFSPWALLVIAAAMALVVPEFATQRIETDMPPLTIALLTAVAITAVVGPISAVTGWDCNHDLSNEEYDTDEADNVTGVS